jgi:dihydrolipoamide dehydrogenase
VSHLAILGGGPGGYVAAIRARQLGADVTLVEMDALGGTCLNRGCIPSKALLRSSEVARLSRDASQFGVEIEFKGVNWGQVMRRKQRVVDQLVKGVEFLMKQNGIRVLQGRGRLAEPHVIAVETEGEEETVAADAVVLAPGSVPSRLPLPGCDGPGVLTSDEMLEIEQIPGSLAIIGGGVIGVEFADVFSAVGTKVTIIEMLPRIVPMEDEEMSAELARSFRRRKIGMFVNARVSEVVERNGKRVIRFAQEGKEQEVEADVVLSAVGRWPNTEQIGLLEAGIEMERRAIKVNGRMETNVPGVYACGDAIGGILLAHVASAEGKVAVANAVGQSCEMDYTAIPSAIYTHPEIGSTGLTEAQAQERGMEVRVGRFHFRASGKALAEGEREGLVKIVVDGRSGRVVGGHIVGPHATDLIHEIVLALRLGATAEAIGDMVHAHPTLTEPIMEAAEDSLGRAIHK